MVDTTRDEYSRIDAVIQFPYGPNLILHREQTKGWSLPMFDRAEQVIPQRVGNGVRPLAAIEEMRLLREERVKELAATEERAAEDRRHNESIGSVKESDLAAHQRHQEALAETQAGTVIGRKTLFWTRVAGGIAFLALLATVYEILSR